MHIVVNTSKQGKKIFSSTLLRESYREDGKTKKRTIANLSHCTQEEIVAMRLALKHKKNLSELGDIKLKHSRSVGAAWVVAQVAKRLGIEAALGESADGKMALAQVIMRVIAQGSRLSCARLADAYSLGDVCGIREGNRKRISRLWVQSRQEEGKNAGSRWLIVRFSGYANID